jgi:hypothetical protein
MKNTGSIKMPEILSHYTQLSTLLCILEQKRIVFGNPKYWEDKTDSKTLEEYAKYNKKDIRALCFTEFPEGSYDNILHWKSYASGKSGCRIDFYMEFMEKVIKEHKNVYFEKVDYLSVGKFKSEAAKRKDKLFFLKHNSYASENEWRAVWVGTPEKNKEFELDIAKYFPRIIKRIRLSPEVPKHIRFFLKKHFKIESVNSWIFENPEWGQTVDCIFRSRRN